MSKKMNMRPTGLVLGMVALLLLAACSGAVSTEQVSEQSPSATVSQPQVAMPSEAAVPTATAVGTAAEVPTAAAVPTGTGADEDRDYQIVTLLPRDAIPAIDNPKFYDVSEADKEYDPEELVLGVELDGEARAYSITLLSRHEIVNDMLAGRPIAVTW